ncbi:MAG: U32 family peptidase [Clostridia bacterium]|nr:U32 family peptidase [Clostridia bacterium]
MNNKVELLSPCGDFERFELAIQYGADAVYLGGNAFTMRAAPKNFSPEELVKATEMAHAAGKKVYLTCNVYAHSSAFEQLPDFLAQARDAGVDAFIIADLGVLYHANKIAPQVDIHISTQAGITNFEAARMYYDLGAKRIVPARELSLEEIVELRAKTDRALEIECFVHGAMCMSVSGRCLLSSFMVGRDANLGLCAQPCRWQFDIMDVTREGIRYPVLEDQSGTYFMNSRDMCMIEHIPALIEAGIDSFKIEGRAKSAYYTAVVTNAYRQAIDGYYANPYAAYQPEAWILEEMEKVSHREYSTGFYFKHPDKDANVDYCGGYRNDWDVVAFVSESDGKVLTLSQRNKFAAGEALEILQPGKKPLPFCADVLYDENLQPIESANHAMMPVKIKTECIFAHNSIVRKQRT